MLGKYDELLNDLYYIKMNFDGIDVLYQKAKKIDKSITKNDVSIWLKNQNSYQLTKAEKDIGKTELLPIYSEDPYSYQIDLTFLPKYKAKNDENYVLFTAINVTTRKAYASYGQDKLTDTIIGMLDNFKKQVKKINIITTDSGSEFTNNKARLWFEHNKIEVFYVIGDSHKLGIINRFHRTLKSKLLKYFLASGSVTWIHIIDKIIHNYNNTFNRGIGFTPQEAHDNGLIQSKIVNDAIDKTNKIETNNEKIYNIGDLCRILKNKELFDKMNSNYSNEIYKIVNIKKNSVSVSLLNDPNKIYHNIKKKYLQIISENSVNPLDFINNNEKEEVEKQHKVKTKLKKEDLKESNIINIPREQRIRKTPDRLNI